MFNKEVKTWNILEENRNLNEFMWVNEMGKSKQKIWQMCEVVQLFHFHRKPLFFISIIFELMNSMARQFNLNSNEYLGLKIRWRKNHTQRNWRWTTNSKTTTQYLLEIKTNMMIFHQIWMSQLMKSNKLTVDIDVNTPCKTIQNTQNEWKRKWTICLSHYCLQTIRINICLINV